MIYPLTAMAMLAAEYCVGIPSGRLLLFQRIYPVSLSTKIAQAFVLERISSPWADNRYVPSPFSVRAEATVSADDHAPWLAACLQEKKIKEKQQHKGKQHGYNKPFDQFQNTFHRTSSMSSLYPSPLTVRRDSGLDGFSSIFPLIRRICAIREFS